jgi:hypothetical protein
MNTHKDSRASQSKDQKSSLGKNASATQAQNGGRKETEVPSSDKKESAEPGKTQPKGSCCS